MIIIDKTLKVPLYKQIKSSIIDAIKQGLLFDGQKILSPQDVSEMYHISIIVSKQAYAELAEEGYIYSVSGTGTYAKVRQVTELTLKDIHLLSVHTTLGTLTLTCLPLFVEAEYRLSNQTQTYDVFKLLLKIGRHPIAIQSFYVEKRKDDKMFDLIASKNYIRDVLKTMNHVVHELQPSLMRPHEAVLLDMPVDAPVYVVKTSGHTDIYGHVLIETILPGPYVRWETSL